MILPTPIENKKDRRIIRMLIIGILFIIIFIPVSSYLSYPFPSQSYLGNGIERLPDKIGEFMLSYPSSFIYLIILMVLPIFGLLYLLLD